MNSKKMLSTRFIWEAVKFVEKNMIFWNFCVEFGWSHLEPSPGSRKLSVRSSKVWLNCEIRKRWFAKYQRILIVSFILDMEKLLLLLVKLQNILLLNFIKLRASTSKVLSLILTVRKLTPSGTQTKDSLTKAVQNLLFSLKLFC